MYKRRILNKKDDIKEIRERYKNLENSKYRQYYHIQVLSGLLNDPNGFSYHNGKWVLFYQWYPFGEIHGQKHWYMTESEDLVNFKNKGAALIPDHKYENNGAYSGSALSINDELNIFYTGNYRDKEAFRKPKQIRSILNKDNQFLDKELIIDTNSNFTEHQRDPSIYFSKEDDKYYLFLGAQTYEKKGCLILYQSHNLSDWEYLGQIKIEGYEDFGYMWECPSFTKIEDKDLLVFSPQGLADQGDKFNNKDNNGYLIGKMDFANLNFIPENEFTQLDRGFEFYASQIASNGDNSYLISWLGLPDVYTSYEGEANSSLSLVRKLSIKENKLFQEIVNLDNYLDEKTIINDKEFQIDDIKPMVLSLSNIKSDFKLVIYGKDNKNGLKIIYKNNRLNFDRRKMDNIFNKEDKNIRYLDLEINELDIYIDKSSVEILINNGEFSLSTRILPSDEENKLFFNSDKELDIEYSNVKKIQRDFVI